jgi:hypothetical protein
LLLQSGRPAQGEISLRFFQSAEISARNSN